MAAAKELTLAKLKKQAEANDAQIKKLQALIEVKQEEDETAAVLQGGAPAVFTGSRSGNSFEGMTLASFGCRSLP